MSTRSAKRLWLGLGALVLLVLFVVGVTLGLCEQERRERLALFSQPFTPHVSLMRGKTPGYSLATLFEVDAHCITEGGAGESKWLVRGRLFDNAVNPPREIWNSERGSTAELVDPLMSAETPVFMGVQGQGKTAKPQCEAMLQWRFNRLSRKASRLIFVVDGVAMPFPMDVSAGRVRQGIRVDTATSADLAAAKQQPGAHAVQQTIALEAQDDSNYHFSQVTTNP